MTPTGVNTFFTGRSTPSLGCGASVSASSSEARGTEAAVSQKKVASRSPSPENGGDDMRRDTSTSSPRQKDASAKVVKSLLGRDETPNDLIVATPN